MQTLSTFFTVTLLAMALAYEMSASHSKKFSSDLGPGGKNHHDVSIHYT